MIYPLTILGLVLLPFYDILFKLFPNVAVIAADTREQREIMSVILAISIGLSALYRGVKPFRNAWLLIFVFLIVISINFIPRLPIVINGIDNGTLWIWRPMFEVLCFLLMLIGISSFDMDIEKILNVMFWCGFIMAVIVILQTAGYDPFHKVRSVEIIKAVKFPERGGTLGQPTLVSPFIAMIIPIALYLRKYIFALFMATAVYLTHSQMAMGALILGCIIYVCFCRPRSSVLIIPLTFITSVFLFWTGKVTIGFSGRIDVWKMIFNEIKDSKLKGYEGLDFSWFGHGLGSFSYISFASENSAFGSPHNFYLNVLYCSGIIGLFLIIGAIIYLCIDIIKNLDKTTAVLASSLSVVLLCSLGSFVLGLGAHIFYTLVIAGLLINHIEQRKLI